MERKMQNIVAALSDLELASLVCLIANEHCIIRAAAEDLDHVQHELELLVENTFGFRHAALTCSPNTKLEDFRALVVRESVDEDVCEDMHRSINANSDGLGGLPPLKTVAPSQIANVVTVRNLDQTNRNVQVQALELIRSHLLVCQDGTHLAPKNFMLIALIATDVPGPPYLSPHLNDYFFISHYHDPSDGLPHTEMQLRNKQVQKPETAWLSSQPATVRLDQPTLSSNHSIPLSPTISPAFLEYLRGLPTTVSTSAEIRRYMHNLVTFLRLHRAVAGGVSAGATRHLTLLCRILAPLHTVSFVTPSLIALAFRKVYPHRVEIALPEMERSMKWGSDLEAVREALIGVTPEVVIEDVLSEVEVPL